jgi:hypothetical protein
MRLLAHILMVCLALLDCGTSLQLLPSFLAAEGPTSRRGMFRDFAIFLPTVATASAFGSTPSSSAIPVTMPTGPEDGKLSELPPEAVRSYVVLALFVLVVVR